MSWKPFVVGVDASPEAAAAAAFAVQAGRRAATALYLVHAVPAAERGPYPYTRRDEELRLRIVAALGNRVPAVLDALSVHGGQPAAVLNGAVAARGAEVIVLGGKHHSTLGRWIGGSTSLSVARSARVPLLVAVGEPAIRRVLVAVDQSEAAPAVLSAAARYASLFDAELLALSVIERLPVVLDMPQPDSPDHYRLLEERVVSEFWPLIRAPGVQTVVRHGTAPETIVREAAGWRADLVVVGSHGKGSVERLLLGSVTEGLINHLPTSLLVVPPRAAVVGHETREVGAVNLEET